VRSNELLYWFNCPAFSSIVILARRSSIFFSVAGSTSDCAAVGPAGTRSANTARAAAAKSLRRFIGRLRGRGKATRSDKIRE